MRRIVRALALALTAAPSVTAAPTDTDPWCPPAAAVILVDRGQVAGTWATIGDIDTGGISARSGVGGEPWRT